MCLYNPNHLIHMLTLNFVLLFLVVNLVVYSLRISLIRRMSSSQQHQRTWQYIVFQTSMLEQHSLKDRL